MMDDLKYAVICVDDDPHILQMLSFQLEKIIDTKCTLLEYFTNPQDALNNFDEFFAEIITHWKKMPNNVNTYRFKQAVKKVNV